MNDSMNPSIRHDNVGNNETLNDVYSPSIHNSTPGSITSNEKPCSSSVSKMSEPSHSSDTNNNHIKDYSTENLEKTLTEESKTKLNDTLLSIKSMKNTEKLLLLIRLMDHVDDSDFSSYELNKTFDTGINQAEHSGALNWVITHLEEDDKTCLRKEDVYMNYKDYCERSMIRVLTSADFGKVMRKVFPNIKPRRLGARGQSKYCYSGLRMSRSCSMNVLIADQIDDMVTTTNSIDLTSIPQYEIPADITVECGTMLVEYFRKKWKKSELNSVKDICKYLLSNEKVDRTTVHANKVLQAFQANTDAISHDYSSVSSTGSMNGSSLLVNLKKESRTDSPKSNASSTPTHNKSNMSSHFPTPTTSNYQSPVIPNSYTQPISLTTHTDNQFPINYANNTHSYNRTTVQNHNPFINSPSQNMSSNYMTSLKPNTASYPNTNTQNVDYPVLNSSLLDNSPTTSKRLKLTSHNLPPANSTSQYMSSNQQRSFTESPFHNNLSQVQSPNSQATSSYYSSLGAHQTVIDPLIQNVSPTHRINSFTDPVTPHTPNQDIKPTNYCNVDILRTDEPCSPFNPSYVVNRRQRMLPNYELFRSDGGLETASNISEDVDQDELNTPRNSPEAPTATSASTTPTSHQVVDKPKRNAISTSSDNSGQNPATTTPNDNNSNSNSNNNDCSDKDDNNNVRLNEYSQMPVLGMDNQTTQPLRLSSTTASLFLPQPNLNSMSVLSGPHMPQSVSQPASNLAAFMAHSSYTNPYGMVYPQQFGMQNYMQSLATSNRPFSSPSNTSDIHQMPPFGLPNNNRTFPTHVSSRIDYTTLSRIYGYTLPQTITYNHQIRQSPSFNRAPSVNTTKSPSKNNEELEISSTTGPKLSPTGDDKGVVTKHKTNRCPRSKSK